MSCHDSFPPLAIWMVAFLGLSVCGPSIPVTSAWQTPTPPTSLASSHPHHHDRRTWFQNSIAATAATLSAVAVTLVPTPSHAATDFATSAGRRGCVTNSDPSRTTVICRGELYNATTSRLYTIPATENGVSTAAIKNPAAYAAPWSYLTETSDARTAWTSLTAVVRDLPDCTIEQLTDTYLHAVVPTQQPPASNNYDDMEFVLRPADNLVLFRSASRAAIFVYPLTQPVSDGNTNRKRLDKVRQRLGWQQLD